jgi:hypothetical protein
MLANRRAPARGPFGFRGDNACLVMRERYGILDAMPFDHFLKLGRAGKHLTDLDAYIGSWVNEQHYRVRYEYEPDYRWDGPIPPGKHGVPANTARYYVAGSVFMAGEPRIALTEEFGVGRYSSFVTAEQPPPDPISLLVGDCLHNLRSCLDVLAYALANAYTKPLPKEVADASEFPIVGDESKKGVAGSGPEMFRSSGLQKVAGWHPEAQAVVKGLQPYHRGKDFQSDPLWLIHDLDRVSKHRLLHPALGAFGGTTYTPSETRNVRALGPGFYDSYGGPLEPDTETPIGRIVGIQRLDPDADVYMPIQPAMTVVFGPSARSAYDKEVVPLLAELYNYVAGKVVPALAKYL